MKKTILYSSMSIDGYIAADGDNLNWLMAFYKSEEGDRDLVSGLRPIRLVACTLSI
jgi:hypothetical protein